MQPAAIGTQHFDAEIVERQLFATGAIHVAGKSTAHSHAAKMMGRPVALSASRITA